MGSKDKTNQFDQDASFWEVYERGRPRAPDSIFETIIKYHSEHGGHFGMFHDAGAGPAVHTARLSHHFAKALVSDPSSSNIEAAEARLKGDPKYSFKVAKMEATDHLEEGSVDMVLACNCIHLADAEKAIDAAAFQLKSGGSFIVTGFGLLVLEDEELDRVWRRVFHQVMELFLADKNIGSRMRETLKTSSCNYDSLHFDPHQFLPGVQRIRMNHIRGLTWRDLVIPAARADQFPYISRKGAEDVTIEAEDEGWRTTFDFAGLREHLRTFLLEEQEDEKFKKLLNGLKDAVGDRTVSGIYPVVLVMATKR